MIDKISGEEIDKLHCELNQKRISCDTICNLLKIKSISEIDKLQYNILLILLRSDKNV